MVSPAGSSSVQGLLDSLAVEAALRVKDEYEGEVTVVAPDMVPLFSCFFYMH